MPIHTTGTTLAQDRWTTGDIATGGRRLLEFMPAAISGTSGPQLLSFALLGGAVVFFAWGRFRYDLVALVALLVAIVTGDVPAKSAFSGFTSDVVIVIASALVVSVGVGKSGLIETLIGSLSRRLETPRSQVPVLAAATAVLSMLTKNVGALAILMPTAIRLGRGTRSSASALLMPMSFLSLGKTVKFTGEPAPRAAKSASMSPPFPPAAETWARTVVLSML